MKQKLTIDELVVDFTKIITFKIITTIRNYYGSLDAFKKACNSSDNKDLARFNKNFHVDSKILQALTRTSDGKRHLDEVLSKLDPAKLHYKHKADVKRKTSGKIFHKPSTFYIPFDYLEELFNKAADHPENPFSTKSEFYNKRQHKLIDKFILNFNSKERKPYTKSEKFIKAIKKRKINKALSKGEDIVSEEDIDILIDELDI